MVLDHTVHENDIADADHARRREQRILPGRHLRRYRCCALLLLALFGVHLLVAGSGGTKGSSVPVQYTSPGHDAPIQTVQAAELRTPLGSGMGAGATASQKTSADIQAAACLNPFDVTCWLQSAAQWVAQQVVNALQTVIDAILNSPLNILTQTPPADTYQNPTLITWFAAFLTVVDLALASLIVITSTSTSVGLCSPANTVPSFAQTVLPQFLHR